MEEQPLAIYPDRTIQPNEDQQVGILRKDDALYSALKEVLAVREIQKIEKLMAAREDRALKKILQNLIKVIPNSVKRRHSIPESLISRLTAVERDGEYVRIVLDGDLDLRTFPSRQQYRNYYYCFRDRLPAMITPESYQALYDITFRLDKGRVIIDNLIRLGLYVPSDSASIIECGAYNGWKALGFSHHLGEKGKILVLEMDDAQYELAKTNLQNNLPQQRFEILHTGVWHTEEERTYSYEHYASHTLKTPDKHSHHSQEKMVKTNTLDNIIERSDIDVFDFLNIQIGDLTS